MDSQSMYTYFESCTMWNSKLTDVCLMSGVQRLMVKATQKSNLSWSAIFSVTSIWVDLSEGT